MVIIDLLMIQYYVIKYNMKFIFFITTSIEIEIENEKNS